MKILVYTDVHWCSISSIVTQRGKKYSVRLDHLIDSMNWVESLDCDLVVCLGDFFDKPNLNAEEISALKEIKWNDKEHYFLVGNHDSNVSDLSFTSAYALSMKNYHIVTESQVHTFGESQILLLPYITEDNRQPLESYWQNKKDENKNQIIFSHNDIKGVQYGKFLSETGFSLDEIDEECSLFVNGHIHNFGYVSDNALNLGNLCGQNFNEDATKYNHYAMIFDTDTLDVEFVENPYALNFYKYIITKDKDIVNCFNEIKNNSVISFKCEEKLLDKLNETLYNNKDRIVKSRVNLSFSNDETQSAQISQLATTNYITQFCNYVLENLDNSTLLKEELSYIVGE